MRYCNEYAKGNDRDVTGSTSNISDGPFFGRFGEDTSQSTD